MRKQAALMKAMLVSEIGVSQTFAFESDDLATAYTFQEMPHFITNRRVTALLRNERLMPRIVLGTILGLPGVGLNRTGDTHSTNSFCEDIIHGNPSAE